MRSRSILATAAITAVSFGAACRPDTQKVDHGTPTPTVVQSPVVQQEMWRTKDGKQLWYRFQTGINGAFNSIQVSNSSGVGCTGSGSASGVIPGSFFAVKAADGAAGCDSSLKAVNIVYTSLDCGTPCSYANTTLTATTAGIPSDLDSVATITAAKSGANLHLSVTSSPTLTLSTVDLYDSNYQSNLVTCATTIPVVPPSSTNFDVPTSCDVSAFPPGNYLGIVQGLQGSPATQLYLQGFSFSL